MAALRDYITQDDFSYGMARDVAPHKIDARAVYDHVNGLYDDDGSPYKRGGTVAHSGVFGTVGSNLVTNPSFEVDTTGWTNVGRDSSFTPGITDGSWCGEFNWGGEVSYTPVVVAPGDPVVLQMDLFMEFEEAEVRLEFLDAGSAVLTDEAATFSATGALHAVLLSGTAPANTATARIRIIPGGVPSTGYIDNVRLYVAEGNGLTFLWDGHLDVGQRTLVADSTNFGVLDSDDETVLNLGGDGMPYPKSAAVIESMLFIGGGYIYGGSRKTADYATAGGNTNLTNGSTTVTDATGGFSANVDPGMLLQVSSSERVYVVDTVDSDTQLTLRDAYEGSTTTTANPTLYPLYEIVTADPYLDSEVYAVCGNRLVGVDGSQVKFSAAPSTTTGKANPHSYPTNNYHELAGGAQATGLATVGLTLLIFSTAGLWTLDGLVFDIVDAEGNAQHRLQFISGDLILVNQSGIAHYQHAIVAPCIDGVYLLDGQSTPRRLSNPIDELWRSYTERGYRLGGAAVYHGHYIVPVLSLGGTTMRDLLVCRLDRPVSTNGQPAYPWSHFNGNGGSLIAYAVRVLTTTDLPLLLGAEIETTSRVVDASGYFSPDATNKYDADGSAFSWLIETRDYETGNLTENMVRRLRTRAELVDAAADNPVLRFDYGLNQRRATDENSILDVNYLDDLDSDDEDGDLILAGDDEGVFYPLNCNMAESDGIDPHNCRVNAKARLIRFRLYNNEPTEEARLRSLEVLVRPSAAVRR